MTAIAEPPFKLYEYDVFACKLDNVMVPSFALHTVGLVNEAVKAGLGFTVTVTVNVLPAHAPDVGVTV